MRLDQSGWLNEINNWIVNIQRIDIINVINLGTEAFVFVLTM